MDIRALVIDIRGDTPTSADRILIDSNVWIGLTDSNPAHPARWQAYSRYVRDAKAAGTALFVSPFSFPEICRYFEHDGLERHNARNPDRPKLPLKSFRDDATGRSAVTLAIKTSWRQISALATLVSTPVTQGCLDRATTGLRDGDLVDGADAMLIADIRRERLTGILSDDRDFGTVDSIHVFTANERLLRSAAQANQTHRRSSNR